MNKFLLQILKVIENDKKVWRNSRIDIIIKNLKIIILSLLVPYKFTINKIHNNGSDIQQSSSYSSKEVSRK